MSNTCRIATTNPADRVNPFVAASTLVSPLTAAEKLTRARTVHAFVNSTACVDALRMGKRIRVWGSRGFVSIVNEGTAWRIVRHDDNRVPAPRPLSWTGYLTIEAAIAAVVSFLDSYTGLV